MKFEDWQQEVVSLMEKDGWSNQAIGTIDWISWKDSYYNEGLDPEESMLCELEAAFS